uniref:Uncharacterized protein n=1 Tax=Xiphophorus couchianus TaxID=32473 RepID=A0A3B5LES1_9TELE
MPERISISDFVELTNEDLSSPGTSSFQSKMSDCKNTVSAVEEVGTMVRWEAVHLRVVWQHPVDNHAHTLILQGNYREKFTVMFLDRGRQLEDPERTCTSMGRTRKVHAERPQVGI